MPKAKSPKNTETIESNALIEAPVVAPVKPTAWARGMQDVWQLGARPAFAPAAQAAFRSASSASLASRLVTQDEDRMELHTREAMMMFVGKPSTEDKPFGVPGGRHAAGGLRQLFALTANDNPYCDLVLLDIDKRVEGVKVSIAQARRGLIGKLDELKALGMSYSIVQAEKPQSVSLGFHSPYGYMVSTLIVMFDELVRVIKSAARRDVINREEQHLMLYQIKHEIRSMFDVALRGQRVLCAEPMRALSRTCFLPESSDPEAAKRVLAAEKIFGVLPQEVYSGRNKPRHSLRRDRIGAKEQALLDAVAAEMQAGSNESTQSVDTDTLI